MGKLRRVIIHPHPDLDACACVAMSGVDARSVHFLPAGEKVLPAQCPCCGEKFTGEERILDHPLGDKGRLEDGTGVRHSAAASMPEASLADPQLIAEVDEQDSTGKATPRFSLGQIVAAVRREASERGVRGAALDREVVTVMARVITGLNLAHHDREEWRVVARNLRFEVVAGFKFAIAPDMETSPNLGIVLNEEFGCSGTIFRYQHNLGVSRFPGRDVPDLRKLAPPLRGWFIHTAGFLAAWGTRKSPATCPPPSGTPQTQDELLAVMRRVFGK